MGKGYGGTLFFSKKGFPRLFAYYLLLTRVLVAEDEGLAIGTLDHSGILFVGTHADSFESAVVAFAGVVSALGNGALDLVVGVGLIHFLNPFESSYCEIIRLHISV